MSCSAVVVCYLCVPDLFSSGPSWTDWREKPDLSAFLGAVCDQHLSTTSQSIAGHHYIWVGHQYKLLLSAMFLEVLSDFRDKA